MAGSRVKPIAAMSSLMMVPLLDDGAIILALGVGSALAAGVVAFAHVVGYDRDRAFYPAVLTVVGSLYVLFAVMAGGGHDLIPEVAFFAGFAALAAIGFQRSLWLVAAGLALHGAFDFVRYYFLAAPGAPEWWPAFCGSFDIVAAIGVAGLLRLREERLAPG